MARRPQVVTVSSKGQVVIPARLRAELGLGTGKVLRIRTEAGRRLVLEPMDAPDDTKKLLSRLWAGARELGLGGVEDLHAHRRQERVREERRFAARRP